MKKYELFLKKWGSNIFTMCFYLPIGFLFGELFSYLKLTPNNITTIKIIINTISLYILVINNNLVLFSLLLILSQFIDSSGGYVARKHNLQSDFGSLYDSSSDGVFRVIFILALYNHTEMTLASSTFPFQTLSYIIIIQFFLQKEMPFNLKYIHYEEKILTLIT